MFSFPITIILVAVWLSPLAIAAPPMQTVDARSPTHTFHPKPAGAYPSPEPCSGDCRSFNDNSIIRRKSDQLLFRFGELNGNIFAWTAPQIYGNWTLQKGTFLSKGLNNPPGENANRTWAPDVHYVEGTYYLFFTVPGLDVIHYATSQTLEIDSWTDQGPLDIPRNPDYNNIGPTFYPTSNPPFLAFGSDKVGIFGVNLTQPPYSVVPDQTAEELVHDERVPGLPANQKHNLTEGAFQYQYGQYHYIFFSRGQCCLTEHDFETQYQRFYRIEACRADSVWGTYYNHHGEPCAKNGRGTVVLQGHGDIIGTGSCGVHNDSLEGEIIHYQYLNITEGKKGFGRSNFMFGWNHLSFESGWPKLVSGGTTKLR